MAYDEKLATRLRDALTGQAGLTERKMFGGYAFMVNGNMCVGVHGNDMIVRLDPAETDRALEQQHTRVFDLSGRPMKGWILVDGTGIAADEDLKRWIDVARAYAKSLPPK